MSSLRCWAVILLGGLLGCAAEPPQPVLTNTSPPATETPAVAETPAAAPMAESAEPSPPADGVPAATVPATGTQENTVAAIAPEEAAAKPAEQPAEPEFTPPELLVGDAAPKLQVGDWLKGEPVEALADDKTYVLEFWATWCGPCIAAIPHVTELQEKYKDSITFLGVNVLENKDADVAAFVEKKGETMNYRVVRDNTSDDPKGAMANTWLKPAEQHGIPCSFVVTKGKIAWIGHPMNLDKVLAEVVDDKWDLVKARADHLKDMENELKVAALQKKIGVAVRSKDVAAVDTLLGQLVELEPRAAKNIDLMKFNLYLQMGATEQAEALKETLAEKLNDEPMGLNQLAWMTINKRGASAADLEWALKLAVRANELTGGKSAPILDTLAKAYFETGDVAKAIETQKIAIEYAGPQAKAMERTLKKYEDKKAADEEKKSE